MKSKQICIILISIILLTGCSRVIEVDEKSFVTAIGIDKGEIYDLRFTLVFTSPSKKGSDASKKEGEEIIVIEAPSVYSAIEQINNFKSKTIELTHTQTLIFSEELAREGLSDYIYMLIRSNHFRPNTYVCITDKSSMEFLEKINPSQTYNLEKYFQLIFNKMTSGRRGDMYLYDSYFRLLSKNKSSVLPYCAINEIKFPSEEGESPTENSSEKSEEPTESETISGQFSDDTDDYAINIIAGKTISKSDNSAEIQGVGVIKDGRFIAFLGREESIVLQLITNSFPNTYFTISNPENPGEMITVYLSQKKQTKINVNCKNQPVIDINIELEGDFTEVGKHDGAIKNPPMFEEYFEQKTKETINAFLNKITKDLNSDICGFSEAAKFNFLTVPQWDNYNWEEKFPNAEFNVDVNLTMRTYGELSQRG